MTPRTTKKRARKGGQTMTSFILSFPEKTPAEEIAQQAKAHGMIISLPYVYATRSKARRSGSGGSPGGRRSAAQARGERGKTETQARQETHLAAMVRIVLDLGLSGARDLLSTVESRLTSAAAKE